MSAQDIVIKHTGLVTSVGLSAPAACAAFRAKLSNPSETRFMNASGQWIVAHQVPLEQPWRGRTKLVKMAAMAIEEALEPLPREQWAKLPLLLCVAEQDRPGRLDGLDDLLFEEIQAELGVRFAQQSAVVAHGRVSVAVALLQARKFIHEGMHPHVLIVATDSLLTWPTLSVLDAEDRLLREDNSNGFMPGEAAGALLVAAPANVAGELVCTGLGFAREHAHIGAEEPLRAEGLSLAIKAALADAGLQMHHMDYRITDISGEQYYFKEAALALARTMRVRREEFDIWHPAECTGEVGAASGVSIVALAKAACEKRYTKGPNVLAHLANDAGQRAALALQFRSAA